MEPTFAYLTCAICCHRKWEPQQDGIFSYPITSKQQRRHPWRSQCGPQGMFQKSEYSGIGQEPSPTLEKGKCHLLTVAIVQEVSDETGAAGGPGLFRVHMGHDRSHDMARGAPMPIQINTRLRVIMEHVKDMACKRRHQLVSNGPVLCPQGAPS